MNGKRLWVLGVLFLGVVLIAQAVPAKAEMYVEAYLGGSASANLHKYVVLNSPGADNLQGQTTGVSAPSVLGGLKIGTWFVPTGFLGYNYPDWMKYFGFYTDFSFQRLDVRRENFTLRQYNDGVKTGQLFNSEFSSEGTAATWAFMLAARYGFFPDSEVPFGRLQPYLGAGPAIVFATQQPKITVRNAGGAVLGSFIPGSAGTVQLGVMAEVGLRYMALKNVSLDISFKYRYGSDPNYHFNGVGNDLLSYVNYNPTVNLFSGQLGVGYHF